jgi:hypothetical protein
MVEAKCGMVEAKATPTGTASIVAARGGGRDVGIRKVANPMAEILLVVIASALKGHVVPKG